VPDLFVVLIVAIGVTAIIVCSLTIIFLAIAVSEKSNLKAGLLVFLSYVSALLLSIYAASMLASYLVERGFIEQVIR
jgi:hypothetical protein